VFGDEGDKDAFVCNVQILMQTGQHVSPVILQLDGLCASCKGRAKMFSVDILVSNSCLVAAEGCFGLFDSSTV
jgi:hypothetical protein